MHGENEKIKAKKRLMSQEKEIKELSECTFTPHLFTARNKDSHSEISDSKKHGERMYEYAEKFKTNLRMKKLAYEQERGQELCFAPKTIATKGITINRNKGEVYQDLYNDHNMRSVKMKEKVEENRVSFIPIPIK